MPSSISATGAFKERGIQEAGNKVESVSRRALPADHWFIGFAMSNQGDCLQLLNRFDEAEAKLISGYEHITAAIGPDHPRARGAAAALQRLYDAAGRSKHSPSAIPTTGKQTAHQP